MQPLPQHLIKWLDSDKGKELMDILFDHFDLDRPAYRPGLDQTITAFNTGHHDMVRELCAQVGYDPAQRKAPPTPDEDMDNVIRMAQKADSVTVEQPPFDIKA